MVPLPLSKRSSPTSWPKPAPRLTEAQRLIQDDWMQHFHERLSTEHRHIANFNHRYAARFARPGRTLEIGAGLGEHISYENLSFQEYHAVELRENMAEAIKRNFPSSVTLVADCQGSLPYDDATFDRVIAIHVLEHLLDLPAALDEVARLLKPGGIFSVVIPCEGGLAYSLGRRFTSERAFTRRYNTSYDWYIASEHVNQAHEILDELRRRFDTADTSYFPTRLPLIALNLLIGITGVVR
jgi:SAM-dependent methyltransferase